MIEFGHPELYDITSKIIVTSSLSLSLYIYIYI